MISNIPLFHSDPTHYRNSRWLANPRSNAQKAMVTELDAEKLMDYSRKLKMIHPTPEEMKWIENHLENDGFRHTFNIVRNGMINKDDIRAAFYKTLLLINAQEPPSDSREEMKNALISKMRYLPDAASKAKRGRLRARPKTLMSGKRSLKGRLEKYRGGGKKKRKTRKKTRRNTRGNTRSNTRRNTRRKTRRNTRRNSRRKTRKKTRRNKR